MSDFEQSNNGTYLTSCSKVTLEAYNRVIKELESIKQKDQETQQFQLKKDTEQIYKEKLSKERLKQEALATNEILKAQIILKQQKDKTEKQQLLSQAPDLPSEVVVAYPRIVETPLEQRKSKKLHFQEEARKRLQEQINEKEQKIKETKKKEIEQESEQIRKIQEKAKKDEELIKQKNKEKLEQYKLELSKDIEAKSMLKRNEKRLEDIEAQGINELQNILQNNSEKDAKIPQNLEIAKNIINIENQELEQKDEKQNIETKKEKPNNEIPDNKSEAHLSHVSDAKSDKLALLLERKQKKANDLIKKIEFLETQSRSASVSPQRKAELQKMKKALAPPSYKMVSEGKEIKISQEEVNKIINKPKKDDDLISVTSRTSKMIRNKSEDKFEKSPIEKAQKIAYRRYLESLEYQANEEQKRILATLKREHEAVDKIKEKEKKLKEQRDLYRHMILDQIAKSKEIKSLNITQAKNVPDIQGEFGYPPIYEPTPEIKKKKLQLSNKKQREDLLEQIREKNEKKHLEKFVHSTMDSVNPLNFPREDNDQKQQILKRKQEEYQKYKESWEMEQKIRKLRSSIEAGVSKPLEPKTFAVPLAPPMKIEKSLPLLPKINKSRSNSVLSGNSEKNYIQNNNKINNDIKPGVFLTEAIQNQNQNQNNNDNEKAQYPWEKRERSREQYRQIVNS